MMGLPGDLPNGLVYNNGGDTELAYVCMYLSIYLFISQNPLCASEHPVVYKPTCDTVRTRCAVLSVSRSLLPLYVNAQHQTEVDAVAMVTRRRRTEAVNC